MDNLIFIRLFCAAVSQILLWVVISKIEKWDKEYCSYVNFSHSFFISGSILLFVVACLGINCLIICQLAVLFLLTFMDYKTKEVYSFVVLLYIIPVFFVSLHNIKNQMFSIVLGLLFYMLSFIKIYALADGIVIFGIVQAIAYLSNNYIINSILIFIIMQCMIIIFYILKCIIKKERLVSENYVPVLPFATLIFYIWILFGAIF